MHDTTRATFTVGDRLRAHIAGIASRWRSYRGTLWRPVAVSLHTPYFGPQNVRAVLVFVIPLRAEKPTNQPKR